MPPRFPIFQFPNKPLVVAIASRALAVRLGNEAGRSARNLSNLALLYWAYEEVAHGANWLRRLLGLGGAAFSARELLTKW